MLKNYFKIALRNLRKHKTSTAINVGGLAVGMACCLWLLMFVQHEWSYDRFHEDADRIVRVNRLTAEVDGSEQLRASSPPVLGPALAETYPEVDTVVRLIRRNVDFVREGEPDRRSVLFADPGFFEVFTFPLIAGNPATALSAPDQIVLTEREAERRFGATDVLGETLTINFQDETRTVTVAGIAEDPPETSSIPFSFVMPLENAPLTYPDWIREMAFETWEAPFARTYVRLASGASADNLEAKLPDFVAAQAGEDDVSLALQPLTAIHLTPEVSGGLASTSDPRYAYILGGIALLVLLMACINFVTLALGRSAERAREVGVRKAVGATRRQLGLQFWAEAVLTSGLALLFGLLLARLFLPVFSELAGVPLDASAAGQPLLWLLLGGLVLGVGILAGGYPAWVLARLEAVPVLQGRHAMGRHGRLSKALVVVQFTLAVGLVATVMAMSMQLRFLSEKNLGFTEDPVVVVDLSDYDTEGTSRFEAFRNALPASSSIRSISNTMFEPLGGVSVALELPEGGTQNAILKLADRDFLQTLEVDLVAGRDFSEIESDRTVLINEAFLRVMGWEEAMGRPIPAAEEGTGFQRTVADTEIGGVVADYHFQSLHEEIQPVIVMPLGAHGQGASYASVRLDPERVGDGLSAVRTAWETIAPGVPLSYSFLHDEITDQYQAEERWRALVGYAALFALLIACFGVFGLAALAVARRTKEISIRKVLGATASSIVALLSKDIALLVLLGAAFGAPLAYYAASRWLEGFAYRIDLSPTLFIGAGLAALAVALLTVSYHALRAAYTNPAEAIRDE